MGGGAKVTSGSGPFWGSGHVVLAGGLFSPEIFLNVLQETE